MLEIYIQTDVPLGAIDLQNTVQEIRMYIQMIPLPYDVPSNINCLCMSTNSWIQGIVPVFALNLTHPNFQVHIKT